MAEAMQLRKPAGAPDATGGQFAAAIKRRDLPSLSFNDLGWAAGVASNLIVSIASGVILSKMPRHHKKPKKKRAAKELKIERWSLYRTRQKIRRKTSRS